MFEFVNQLIEQNQISFILIGGGILLIAILIGLFFIFRKFLHQLGRIPAAFEFVVLLITLPKESTEGKQGENPRGPQALAEAIGVAETLFSSIGGLRAQRGFKAWLFGRTDHLSFEIVAHESLISFYVATPRYMQQFIEQQIQAQFPTAVIEEVEDYNIFTPESNILGTYLTFKQKSVFPIKTYKKAESDPLNALTNTLSKLGEEDGAAMQFVVRSAKKEWRREGIRIAREMQQGKKLSEVLHKGIFGGWADVFKTQVKPQPAKPGESPKQPYKLTPLEEEMVKSLEEKANKLGLDVNVRLIATAKDKARAQMYLNNMVSSFSQYNIPQYGNVFKASLPGFFGGQEKIVRDFIFRNFNDKAKIVLNTEEMASIYHFSLPTTETPNIRWLMAKKAPAPVNAPKEGILLGYNEYRGIKTDIRIKLEDRFRHVYIIGKSGVGKSVLLANMIVQDILNGDGVAVIDPHGDLVEDILPFVPKERIDDVIYFCPSDTERPLGLNMLEYKTDEQKDFAVQEMIAIFYKLFGQEMIGPMFEHYMRNAMLALMEDKETGATIIEIPRMFTDKEFRRQKLTKVQNPVVKNFWEQEYEQSQRGSQAADMLSYVISKIGRFLTNDMMRNIIGQARSGFDFREVMDNRKILLVNLAKGTTGEVNSNLLGMILVTKLQVAAMGRVTLAKEERKDFFLYIDEFQNFITDSVATILSEARKYRFGLVIAHQYIGQLVQGQDTKIRDAVFGNVGTIISFRIGVEDAEAIAKEFAPIFSEYDVINAPMYTAYLKLLIDNTASKAFNMATFPPKKGDKKIAEAVKQLSRLKYGRNKTIIEAEIMERSHLGELAGAGNAGSEKGIL
jgi:type IV secretory pathway TraG/TraD family ATPase VirD4